MTCGTRWCKYCPWSRRRPNLPYPTYFIRERRREDHHTVWLNTTDSLGRAIASLVVLRRHAWLRSTGFSEDVQAGLMDMPFDDSRLFCKKADSALEYFKESRVTTRSLGLSIAPASLSPPFTPPVAMVGASKPIHNTPRTLRASRLPSLFVAVNGVPTEAVGPKASVESSPPPPAASKTLYGALGSTTPSRGQEQDSSSAPVATDYIEQMGTSDCPVGLHPSIPGIAPPLPPGRGPSLLATSGSASSFGQRGH